MSRDGLMGLLCDDIRWKGKRALFQVSEGCILGIV